MDQWFVNAGEYLWKNWGPVLAYLSALGGMIRYLVIRRDEALWKKTEFLFNIGRALDEDSHLQETLMILEGRNPSVTVEMVFDQNSSFDAQKRGEIQQVFDRFFNFLDRLHYAVVTTKTLSLPEASMFGWYLEQIPKHKMLVEYCQENGFHHVLELEKMLTDSDDKPLNRRERFLKRLGRLSFPVCRKQRANERD